MCSDIILKENNDRKVTVHIFNFNHYNLNHNSKELPFSNAKVNHSSCPFYPDYIHKITSIDLHIAMPKYGITA